MVLRPGQIACMLLIWSLDFFVIFVTIQPWYELSTRESGGHLVLRLCWRSLWPPLGVLPWLRGSEVASTWHSPSDELSPECAPGVRSRWKRWLRGLGAGTGRSRESIPADDFFSVMLLVKLLLSPSNHDWHHSLQHREVQLHIYRNNYFTIWNKEEI